MSNVSIMLKILLGAVTLATTLLASTSAYAYVGPGLGLGTIGAVLGTLAAILLAIFAVLYYPIKRLFKKKKSGSQPDIQPPNAASDDQRPLD